MKKYLLLLIILLLPVTAKADRALDYGTFTLYSDKEQPTKGSNIFFKTEELCDDFSCDGMLMYNADELQFNSVTYEIPNIENKDKLETAIKVLEDKPGSIKYDFQLKNLESINKNEENNYVTLNIIAKFNSIN